MKEAPIWLQPVELAANGGALLVHLTFKATLLLLVTFAVVGTSRRSSAALRHTLWSVCYLGLLLLPAFTIALPAWQPARINPLNFALDKVTDPPQLGSAWQTTSSLLRTVVVGHNELAPVISTEQRILTAIFVCWLLGAAVIMRKIALGFIVAKRLQHQGLPVDEGQLWNEFMQCATSLNMPVSVLMSPPRLLIIDDETSPIPLTWGCWYPVVLMPHASMQWSASCRRAALLHELSHIQRFDWLIQLGCSLAHLFFWFHPLVWFASWNLRLESERATDDHVLATGLKATDYSSSLLEIVRFVSSHRESGATPKDSIMKFAVPLSGTSKIETRLRSILDPKRSRSAVTKPRLAAISLVSFTVIVPLAAAKETTKSRLDVASSQATIHLQAQPVAPLPTNSKPLEKGVVTGFKFSGNTVLKADDLQNALVSRTDVTLNPQSVAADVAAIGKSYSDKGFAVLVQNTSQDDDGIISYSLLEAKLTQIKLLGLTKTHLQVVRKLILTPVDEPFDASKLRRDLSRLYDTKLFADASFKTDDDPDVKGGVIATFTLKE